MDIDKRIAELESKLAQARNQIQGWTQSALRFEGALAELKELKNADTGKENNVETIEKAKARKHSGSK